MNDVERTKERTNGRVITLSSAHVTSARHREKRGDCLVQLVVFHSLKCRHSTLGPYRRRASLLAPAAARCSRLAHSDITVSTSERSHCLNVCSQHRTNRTELTCNKSTQLRDASRQVYWSRASTPRLDWLQRNEDGLCSVLNTCIPCSTAAVHTGVRELEFSSVQFVCCEQAFTVPLRRHVRVTRL